MSAIGLTGAPSGPTLHPRGGASELLEQRETTAARMDAYAAAVKDRSFARRGLRAAPAPGWIGARTLNPVGNDWEPAVAADPERPIVYWLSTRYGRLKPCRRCPNPYIVLRISRDGGDTWEPERPLVRRRGPGQFDPIIEVVPGTGHVYALYMDGFDVVFTKSTDRGRTWSDPVPTYGAVAWNDKPALTTNANGRHVYVSWNGPTVGDPYVAVSHDAGATWRQEKVVDGGRYFYAYDGTVLPDGTVAFSQSSLSYAGGDAVGQVLQHVFISRNRGRTWTNVVADRVRLGIPCRTRGCYPEFHSGHSGIGSDETGRLYHVYDGAVTNGGPQAVWFRRSNPGATRWSSRVRLSPRGVHTTGPTIEATGRGDVRVWYAAQGERRRWSIYAISSDDRGRTWSAPVKISDALSGARYDSRRGFREFYGDYGEIAITKRGKTVAVWGAGFSYLGPGNAWVNVED